jgi:hypothetical protein
MPGPLPAGSGKPIPVNLYTAFTPRGLLFTKPLDLRGYSSLYQHKPFEGENGHRIYRRYRALLRRDVRVRGRLRKTWRGPAMNLFYVVGALAAGGLLVYLVVSLLKAEEL